jgi:glycerol-3-phosphate O-acyltransferase
MKFQIVLNAEAQMMMVQIFNVMKTANHIVLFRHKKSLLSFFMSNTILFFFFLEAFINYFTIKEKEIAKNTLWYRSHMASKKLAFDK